MKTPNNTPQMIMQFPVDAKYTVITMGRIQYDTPWKHFPRCCNEYIMYFIESGDLFMEEEGVRYHLEQNSALLLEPGKRHCGYQAACVAYYYIHFTSSVPLTGCVLTDALQEQIIQLHVDLLNSEWNYQWNPSPYDTMPLHFPKHAHLGGTFSYFQSLEDCNRFFFESLEGRRGLPSLRLQEIITMLCREFAEGCINPGATKASILVRDIRRYISNHFDSEITSQTISQQFFVNYDYANRLFKRYTRQSIHDYLISYRIHRAKRLIASGTKIGDAAELVGIKDAAYFSRLFKKLTGMSPSAYAKKE